MGFVARPWLTGASPRVGDATDDLLVQLTRYLVAMAGEPLTALQLAAARERRVRWTLANLVRRDRHELAAVLDADGVPNPRLNRRAFDYDPAPPRWTRVEDRSLKRNGVMGRYHPHTIVGDQPLLWDLAALICEWQLDSAGTRLVIGAAQEAMETQVPHRALRAFVLAFLAFKIGLMTMCRDDEGLERARLEHALTICEARVDRLLSDPARP
jgi:hypothetical protein